MSRQDAGAAARRPTSVKGITGLRLLPPGASAQLVNMSETGLLAESMAKVQVGAAITVGFDGGFSPATVTGRVVRCEVAVMGRDGLLRYHIGIEFDAPLPLDESGAAAPASPPSHLRNRW